MSGTDSPEQIRALDEAYASVLALLLRQEEDETESSEAEAPTVTPDLVTSR